MNNGTAAMGRVMISPGIPLVGLLLLTAFCLWPAMDGPLVHDDHRNLAPFYGDKPDYRQAIFGNDAGPMGRVLTMASFALNRVLDSTMSVRHLKITNLAIHLVNGVLLFYFLFHLFARRYQHAEAAMLALAGTAIWLLNPVNSETVLYIIQRSTLLATTFMLLACLVYLHIRRTWKGFSYTTATWSGLCVLLWVCAVYSKENALLLPLVILLLEISAFRDLKLPVVAWAGTFLALPLSITGLYIVRNYGFLDYSNLPYSMWERLYTQPLVIASYLRESLLPYIVETGLFRDDFPVRDEFWNLPGITALGCFAGLLVFALVRLRDKPACLAFGILFFFVTHLLESSFFPLELYYRHRNYFPSVGMVIALVLFLYSLLRARFAAGVIRTGFLFYCLTLAYTSYSQSQVWSSYDLLLGNAYQRHPASVRLNLELGERLLRQGDVDTALQLNGAIINDQPVNALPAKIQRFYLYCLSSRPVPDGDYAILESGLNLFHPHLVSNALSIFIEHYGKKRCDNVDLARLSAPLIAWSDARRKAGSHSLQQLWTLDYYLLQMLHLQGRVKEAEERLALLAAEGSEGARYLLQLQAETDKNFQRD